VIDAKRSSLLGRVSDVTLVLWAVFGFTTAAIMLFDLEGQGWFVLRLVSGVLAWLALILWVIVRFLARSAGTDDAGGAPPQAAQGRNSAP
jgi:hypothetical protein